MAQVVTKEEMQKLVGLREAEARNRVKVRGYVLRVMKEDTKELLGSSDYREDRINVSTNNGVVSEIKGVG